MAIQKNITIDGIEVPFKASAAVPRLYRLKFRRDIYKDFASLKTEVTEGDENKSEIGIESLEVFENIAYIMACLLYTSVPQILQHLCLYFRQLRKMSIIMFCLISGYRKKHCHFV